jgi:geranylgeranyl reductase family protein
MSYDVVVAGGSVAGLFCAREIAAKGHSVLVIEEDFEIGTPEHCGGLVSESGLEELGVIPSGKTFDSQVTSAEVTAPNGKKITIDAKKQNVSCISRRELDKQIAHQAQKNGAEIRVKTSFKEIRENKAVTTTGEIDFKMLVDARGVSALVQKDRTGMLQSAQYEVYADWIEKGKVEVNLDAEKYPGFFSWIIPSCGGAGKVGVAGRGINAMQALEKFLNQKGKCSVIRKVFAPIWVNGPIENFVSNNIVTIGDAAGQSKPTTAGGIYSCGMGGIYAGKAISKFLETKRQDDLESYQKTWVEKFGKEFERQSFARKMLERLDNKSINTIFDSLTPEMIADMSNSGDFDFHTSTIIKMLGLRGSLKVAQTMFGAEIRKVLG